MISILGQAGKQSLNNQQNMSMDPKEFQKFMSQRSTIGQIQDQTLLNRGNNADAFQYFNQQKIKSKEDYAKVLQMQIEEKKSKNQAGFVLFLLFRVVQKNQNQNPINTSFESRFKTIDQQNKKQDQINQKQPQIYYPFGTDHKQNFDNQQGQQSIIYQNDQRAYEQGKSIRGILKREQQSEEQLTQQEIKAQQYKQELLAQIEEKKQRQLQQKQQDDLEDYMYMDRVKKQQEDLGNNINPSRNDARQISQLRKNLQNDQNSINDLKKNEKSMNQQQPLYQQSQPNIPIFIPPIIKIPESIQPTIPEIYQPKSMIDQEQLINQQYNYAQTRVDLDVMKQYYNYQQQLVERDMSNIKEQLVKVDQTRIAAERELLYLQERAKEKKIWSILDYQSDAFIPNMAYENKQSIFRTAKYTIGNMTESEKRQKILDEFYKSDKSKLSLGPLYRENTQQINVGHKELETMTELIIPKNSIIQKQEQLTFDNTQLQEIENIKRHDKLILTHINQNLQSSNVIKDKQQYQDFLKESSLIEIMKEMQEKGDKKVMTPLYEHQIHRENEDDIAQKPDFRKQKTQGDITEIKFMQEVIEQSQKKLINNPPVQGQDLDQNQGQDPEQDLGGENQGKEVSQQQNQDNEPAESSIYELDAGQRQKTEDLITDKVDEKVTSNNQFDWQSNNNDQIIEKDPLDDKINDVLENITGIVSSKPQQPNYYRIQLESRVKQEKDKNIPYQELSKQQNPNNQKWKPIKFAKTTQQQAPPQYQQSDQQFNQLQDYGELDDDHLKNLDHLLKNFMVQK